MNAATSLKLFQLTQEFIPDAEKAREFVSRIEQTVDQKFDEKSNILLTKNDLHSEMTQLRKEMADNKNDTLKFIVMVGLGQVITIIGAILAIINFIR